MSGSKGTSIQSSIYIQVGVAAEQSSLLQRDADLTAPVFTPATPYSLLRVADELALCPPKEQKTAIVISQDRFAQGQLLCDTQLHLLPSLGSVMDLSSGPMQGHH